MGAPTGTDPLQVATPLPNGPSLQEYAAGTVAFCAYVAPSGGVVMVMLGPVVSGGTMVVVASAGDELG
jgi:hypothetical protein